MKKIQFYLVALLLVGSGLSVSAQLTCTNDIFADTTSYTNGQPNDSIFFICSGQQATLVANPPSGVPGWNFVWQQFNVAGNSWNALTTVTNAPTSTQTVNPGGYRVTITDGNSETVGVFIAWVCRINTNPSVNVNPITPGCGNVQLSASINNGSITPYYNTPVAIDANQALIVNNDTQISVCFTAEHSFISDLAFHLRGPASCGSPDILLAPSPGVCNGCCVNGDNDPDINNLCFSTEVTNALNMCSFSPNEASGTFGAYGAAATLINWTPLNGCDASQAGWSVQIYDCVGADVGSLTDATLTFSGTSVGGDPITYSYSTPSNFSSAIADNSCTAASASIFTVPSPPAVPINFTFGYQWTADPPIDIPNATSSLNITVNPGPQTDTYFTLQLTGTNPGAICGGTDSDTELFDYIEPGQSFIEPVDPSYCEQSEPFNLVSDQPSGTWSGTGITNPLLGTFSPAFAGEGTWTVTFTPSTACVNPSTIDIVVESQPVASISDVPALCSTSDPYQLIVDYPGGTWSGAGIADPASGIFDPSLALEGSNTVDYFIDGVCPIQGSIVIDVVQQDALEISSPSTTLCAYGDPVAFTSNLPGGVWAGTGIADVNLGIYDPIIAGPGTWEVTYIYNDVCFDDATFVIEVVDTILQIDPAGPFCVSASAVNLSSNSPGGIWTGPGIVASSGSFDPSSLGVAGVYTVYYASGNACQEVDSLDIELQGFPPVTITVPDEICQEASSILLSASVPGGTWSGDGIVEASSGLFDPSAAGAGNASVTYTVSGICESSDTDVIVVNATPNVNAGIDASLCDGSAIFLNASGAASYSWQPTTGLSNANVPNPQASPSSSLTYTVTGTSAAGCQSSDNVQITVFDAPVVSVNGPFTICSGDEIQLIAGGLDIYNWTGENLSEYNIANPIASPAESETYQVTGFDANGCEGSASIQVNVIQPVSYFTASTDEGMSPLTVTFFNASSGDSYFWDFGNGSTLNTEDGSLDPSTEFIGEGTYTVTVTTTLDGCTSSYSFEVYVFYDAGIVGIPNIVTMNGDGRNDTFLVLSNNLRSMDVQIFDRWGKNVGEITRPNGEWNPRDAGNGTYYYVLNAEGYDGKKFDRAGSFTVISE